MTCPCCGGEDTAGIVTVAVICWDCQARFAQSGDTSVFMIDCSCGRHDDGKIIKEGMKDEK